MIRVVLAYFLGLEGKVKFLGFQKPDEIFPKLGLTVLTSISEALPLVVLRRVVPFVEITEEVQSAILERTAAGARRERGIRDGVSGGLKALSGELHEVRKTSVVVDGKKRRLKLGSPQAYHPEANGLPLE